MWRPCVPDDDGHSGRGEINLQVVLLHTALAGKEAGHFLKSFTAVCVSPFGVLVGALFSSMVNCLFPCC